MFQDFKKFIMRGNVFDLAVGIIIGTAFGKIVSSFVSDVLMPPIGLMMGRVDFTNLFINISGQTVNSVAEAEAAGLPIINIWHVYQHPDRFSDHCLCDFHPGQTDGKNAAQAGGRRGAGTEGVPILPDPDRGQSNPLPQLHFNTELKKSGRNIDWIAELMINCFV